MRHQINVNWLAELPFGQGKKFGGNVSGAFNQLIGDWSIAGLTRWTSGFPFNVYNCRSCWATNWNLQGNAMLVDPDRLPATETTRTRWTTAEPVCDATDALTYFRRALPGEVGFRNALARRRLLHHRREPEQVVPARLCRSPAALPLGHVQRHQHAEVRRGPARTCPDRAGFGRYDGTLATCDAQAGRCMQFALRYEF